MWKMWYTNEYWYWMSVCCSVENMAITILSLPMITTGENKSSHYGYEKILKENLVKLHFKMVYWLKLLTIHYKYNNLDIFRIYLNRTLKIKFWFHEYSSQQDVRFDYDRQSFLRKNVNKFLKFCYNFRDILIRYS